MISLIKAEFKKIFKKKSFYIVSLIFVLYCILTNVIYKNLNSLAYYEEAIDTTALKEENATLNLDKEDDKLTYIDNMTIIEVEKLKEKYNTPNQEYLINNYLEELISEKIANEMAENDPEIALELEKEITEYENLIKNNEWKYFVNLNITKLQDRLQSVDEYTAKRLNDMINLNNYRLNNEVDFGGSFLDNAIKEVEIDLLEYYNLKNKNELSDDEENRLKYLNEEMAINKYILETKKDVNNQETLKAVLTNFPSEFGLFILIYVIMVSGSIVSEEFNKGTIKYLLTKPFKRGTILLAKLIVVLLFIPIVMIFLSILELIIGGILLGFDSLSVPVLIFNGVTNTLNTYPVLVYLPLILLCNIPIYLVLGLIGFAIGTITTSTSAATTITFLFYLVGNVISNLALSLKVSWFKYFVSLHWDFSYLVNLSSNPYGFKTTTSLIVIGIYLLILLSITFVYFQKKDVKNI